MLQSVAHRSRPREADVWTSAESRERHQARARDVPAEAGAASYAADYEADYEANDDALIFAPEVRDGIGGALAAIARAANARPGGATSLPAYRTLDATPLGTGNTALDEAIADLPERLGPDDRADDAPIIGIFSSDPMIQRIGLRELFNRDARLLFIALGDEVLAPPRFYRWQAATTDVADDRPAPALPHAAVPAGIDTIVWQALGREGLLRAGCRAWLGGYFRALDARTVAADAARRQPQMTVLRLRLVAHGTTIDAEGRHPLRRFAGIAAPALADYLLSYVFPASAPLDTHYPAMWIDFVACALAVPGECATSRHSYIGTMLRTLHERTGDGPLMARIRVSASTYVLMFEPGNFKKRREVVVAGLTLTPTRAQLRELGLASTVTVIWRAGAPFHCDADAPALDARARNLLSAYAEAWADWEKRGRRWRKHDVPSRFVLFDTLLDTTVRLEHKDDIAVIQTFIDRVSPGAWGAATPALASGGAQRPSLSAYAGAPPPRSDAVPIRQKVRTVSLDHGEWRAHYDAPSNDEHPSASTCFPAPRFARAWQRRKTPASSERQMPVAGVDVVGGSLAECAVSLALALQKIMTSRGYLSRLSKTRQKALRRYAMTPWRMVDEAVFRRIGLPTTAADFIARWKGLASDSRPVRMGGEVLQGLLTIGMPHDAAAVRRVVALALYDGSFRHLSDPDRQAFLSGDGALVFYGRVQDAAAVSPDRRRSAATPLEQAGQRVGWHVHAFENGRPVCRWLDDSTAWEAALGALGRTVAKHASEVLFEIDAVRMRLVADVLALNRAADGLTTSRGVSDGARADIGHGDCGSPDDACSIPDSGSGGPHPGVPGRPVVGFDGRRRGDRGSRGDADRRGEGNDVRPTHPIWGSWCDARARQSADDDRHGCSGSPRQ